VVRATTSGCTATRRSPFAFVKKVMTWVSWLDEVCLSIFSNRASSSPSDTTAYVAGLLGLLGDDDPVMVLRETPDSIRRFLDNLPAEMGVRPEAPGKWSIRDVVQHRADAELVDGFRLRMILAQDRPALVGYDQDLWASRLGYNVVQLEEARVGGRRGPQGKEQQRGEREKARPQHQAKVSRNGAILPAQASWERTSTGKRAPMSRRPSRYGRIASSPRR